MDKNRKKGLQELKYGPEADTHLKSIRATLKKEQNWETRSYEGRQVFWFKSMIDCVFNWEDAKKK